MRIARSIGLPLGLICLLGIGLASFSRGQQAVRGVTEGGRQRQDGHETVARLEAEVESLSLDHEVAKADLQNLLRKCNRLELVREIGSLTAIGMTQEFCKEVVGEKAIEGMQRLDAFASAHAPEEKNKEWESMASADVKRMFDSLHAFRGRKQQEFIEKTIELNKKKRELSEFREQSKGEAR